VWRNRLTSTARALPSPMVGAVEMFVLQRARLSGMRQSPNPEADSEQGRGRIADVAAFLSVHERTYVVQRPGDQHGSSQGDHKARRFTLVSGLGV
jgi:hypothetical protein